MAKKNIKESELNEVSGGLSNTTDPEKVLSKLDDNPLLPGSHAEKDVPSGGSQEAFDSLQNKYKDLLRQIREEQEKSKK